MGAHDAGPPAQKGTQTPHRPVAVETPEPLTTNERWPRRARLARGPDLQACLTSGRRARTPHLDLAWRPNPAGHPRMGVIVPRFQHSAVARNRLRRRLREILRRGPLGDLSAVDLVVRAKRSAYDASFAVLRAELAAALAQVT